MGSVHMQLARIGHVLAQQMNQVYYIRPSNREVKKTANKSAINSQIQNWVTYIGTQLDILFHRECRRSST